MEKLTKEVFYIYFWKWTELNPIVVSRNNENTTIAPILPTIIPSFQSQPAIRSVSNTMY